ncbi:MAG: EAL domain-containing protein [Ruthenibacterium sp.]
MPSHSQKAQHNSRHIGAALLPEMPDAAAISFVKSILIVDDDRINRAILKKILSDDYRILEAENGQAALSLLRANHKDISVVLLDIVMPVLDGYEVLRQMRQDSFLSKMPVIVTSGQDTQDAEVKALSLGANDYVLKPYQPDIIKHRISNVIYLRETSAFANFVQHDSLTGIYVKEYFYLEVSKLLQLNASKRYDLVCMDVEHFKLVNDIYGIQVGDALLRYIAAALTQAVDGQGICGRIVADEFICFIPHREDYRDQYFTDFTAQINSFSDAIQLDLVVRYGIYCIEDSTTPVNIMCDRAILSKESIKGQYARCFAYYDDKLRQKLLDEQLITSSMRTALAQKQFKVYYQPKYDLNTEEIVGAEALVRWVHPQKGFMRPDEFIPLFEKNGFITDLDFFVWEECCRNLGAWIAAGHTATPLSINVSRMDIYNPKLPSLLLSLLQKYKISPKYLHLEITETAYTENPEQLIEMVSKLKRLGFIIEMDDFGTGYSSLNMLSELPLDVLKLDMRFIQQADTGGDGKSILGFVINLAKWMDLKVVAEGVETKAQVQLLQSLDCEYAQGYYYAKPLPQEEFEQHLLRSNIQALHRISREQACLAHLADDGRDILLVLDPDSVDFPLLQKNLSYRFCVRQVSNPAEATSFLSDLEGKLSAIVISFSAQSDPQQMSRLLAVCKKNNVAAIGLCDKNAKNTNDILALGVSDCITRPYVAAKLELRLQNAIAFARMEKFEQAKAVNAAILEMRKRSERDSLTGLLNRTEFEERIDSFFHSNMDPSGIFIIADIDNFKVINDTFGHVAGDNVLRSVGSQISRIFDETDMISRLGGDEFAIFIPYPLDSDQLQEKLHHLCERVSFETHDIVVSCSAGLCLSPEHGTNRKDLYHHADRALLAAKRHGKGRFECFSPDMVLPIPTLPENETARLLDYVSDSVFVCDSVTGEIIYINQTACSALGKTKEACLGLRCYQLFWDQCHHCNRCIAIAPHLEDFYEESTYLTDHKTPVHIRARQENWDGRNVKVHYLRIGTPEPPKA